MTSSSLSPRSSLSVIIRWYGRLVAASPTVPTQTSRSSRAFVTCSAFAELASRFAVMMIAIEELPKGELYGRNFWFNTSPTGGSGNRLLRRFLSISLGRDEAGGDCLQRGPLHRGGGGAIVLQVSILSTRSCLPWDCLLGWQFLGRQYIKGVPKKWLPEFSRMTGHLLVDYLSNHYFSHQARVNIERIMIWPSADRSSLKIQKYTFFGTPYCIFTNCSHGNLLPSVMRCTWRPEAARNFLRRRVSLDSWREGRSLISSSLTCKVGGILSHCFGLTRRDTTGHENTQLFGHESPEDMVHKFVFLSDDRNIKSVWVNGRKVKDTLGAILPQWSKFENDPLFVKEDYNRSFQLENQNPIFFLYRN